MSHLTCSGMAVSAAFATTLATPEHVQIAEEFGYRRAWLYDTPQQSPDVWMSLALAAERTHAIGLGPGVLVPTLRHPMVNASAAAALERLAPGRVAIGFGTGYTGRRAMGQPKPISWAYMSRYITAFRALLRGEIVDWDGATLRMLHTPEALANTDTIPIYLGAVGPKGLAVAETLTDRLFVGAAVPGNANKFRHIAFLAYGTVLDDREAVDSPRVRTAAGPGLMQTFHGSYEFGGEQAVHHLPGGPQWLAVVNGTPERERHLTVHAGHLIHLNDADTAAWNAGAHTMLQHATLTGTSAQIRDKVQTLAAQGVTEFVYQPAGDIPRELEAFATAVA